MAASPQLRRDIQCAVAVGVSPRRYAGWEPVTRYSYDAAGRVAHTRPEPEWDEWDQALVDAWLNWQAGLHTCGHHESETADPGVAFVASFTECRACAALQAAQESRAKVDEPALKAGRNPDYPRRWRVDAVPVAAAVRDPDWKSPQQRMLEAMEAMAKLEASAEG